MRIAVTGSIATDHLMSFPGRFADQFIQDKIESISLSFLVDSLEVRRGGVAGNIAFGMGILGLRPVLIGAVGNDFADYRSSLEDHGVDTASVHVSADRHTARFLATTDADLNQISSFYTGAMAEAREIELKPVVERFGGLDLVLISPNDPEAMLRHTEECRRIGIPFAADPSQQLARMDDADEIRSLFEGAAFLFGNEYEKALIEQKTGLSDAEVLKLVGARVTTLGPKGVRIDCAGEPSIQVPSVTVDNAGDPTGVGDAFRAGFLSGVAWKLPVERAAQVGHLLAATCLAADGPQEYLLDRQQFLARLGAVYGAAAEAEVGEHL